MEEVEEEDVAGLAQVPQPAAKRQRRTGREGGSRRRYALYI